jgi:hypothetical protein
LFIILLSLTSGTAQTRFPGGADEAGMGYACLTRPTLWSAFNNQANLAFSRKLCAGFNYVNRFGLTELSTKTAGMIIPVGNATVGGVYSYFGYHDFRRHSAGLSCGLNLTEKLAAGVQIDYFSEMTYGEYEDHRAVACEIGMLLSPDDNIRIGIHLFNPLPRSLSSSLLPSVIRAGAGVILSSSLFAGVEAEMSTEQSLMVRTGYEYEAFKKIWIRGGFCTNNTSFSFGLGYRLDFVQLDLAFVTHEKLGMTSSASMIFQLK